MVCCQKPLLRVYEALNISLLYVVLQLFSASSNWVELSLLSPAAISKIDAKVKSVFTHCISVSQTISHSIVSALIAVGAALCFYPGLGGLRWSDLYLLWLFQFCQH